MYTFEIFAIDGHNMKKHTNWNCACNDRDYTITSAKSSCKECNAEIAVVLIYKDGKINNVSIYY